QRRQLWGSRVCSARRGLLTGNGFREAMMSLKHVGKKMMCKQNLRMLLRKRLQSGARLSQPAHVGKAGRNAGRHDGCERIEAPRLRGFNEHLVGPPEAPEKLRIPMVCGCVARVQFERPSKLFEPLVR